MMWLIRAAAMTAIALGLVYASQHLPQGEMREAVEMFAALWVGLSTWVILRGDGGDAPRA